MTGLLTTAGFRDLLEMGRETKYDVYDPYITFPEPLVPRPLRIGVRERVLPSGAVLHELTEEDIVEAAEQFRRAGVTAIAVCYLHAYRNGAHERRTRALLAELLPSVPVSISSEVHPEPREFERTSTTVVNAYVQPMASSYLHTLSEALLSMGHENTPCVMQSNGGAATFAWTKEFPVQAVESGPAAGVLAASHYGSLIRLKRLLSFDMGGTTAKLCVVRDGKPSRTRTFEVDRLQRFKAGSGLPIATPVFDLLEIGSGGGSIARIDSLGLLQVGPDSAGSVPGPACYGRGGEYPTVTDANLVLGFLDGASFLGGSMALDVSAAETAIQNKLAKALNISIHQAAWGIHDLVNETMASAARVHIAEKGQNAAELTMVAFGGAGPVQAVELARKLGCPAVLVPPLPGVMSAFGLLTAPISVEKSLTIRRLLQDIVPADLEAWLSDLERQSLSSLQDGEQPVFVRSADIWRSGQDYAIEVPLPEDCSLSTTLDEIARAFSNEYSALYGRVDDSAPLELVSLRVRAERHSPPPRLRVQPGKGATPLRSRPVYIPTKGTHVTVPVFERSQLGMGDRIEGPAIVEERESTTVVGEGDLLVVDEVGCLHITLAR